MPTPQKAVKNMDTFINLLRMLSYGCYPRNDATLFGMSPSSYDDYLRLARFYLPKEHLAKTQVGKQVHIHFQGDAYHTPFNFLSYAYASREIPTNFLEDCLYILQTFHYLSVQDIMTSDFETPGLSETEIKNMLESLVRSGAVHRNDGGIGKYNEPRYAWKGSLSTDTLEHSNRTYNPSHMQRLIQILQTASTILTREQIAGLLSGNTRYDIAESTLKRRLEALLNAGFLACWAMETPHRYHLFSNPLSHLTSAELKELLYAISFGKNLALLTFPGCRLEERLSHILSCIKPKEFLILNNNFVRILNDETMLTLLETRNSNNPDGLVSFRYRGSKQKYLLIPQEVSTDFIYHWEYVMGQTPDGTHTYRVDLMNVDKSIPKKPLLHAHRVQLKDRSKIVSFLLHCNNELECKTMQARVKNLFPLAQIVKLNTPSPSENTFVPDIVLSCQITCTDPLKLLPWLRTFYPALEILPSNTDKLRDTEKDKLKEALKNYGTTLY